MLMFSFNTYSKWHALFVHTGEEDNVKERIHYRFGEDELAALVPKRRMRERKNGNWSYRTRTLFPGYVLINGNINEEQYYKVKEIPGVITFIKDKNGPLPVDESEINLLLRFMKGKEIIESSRVLMEGSKIIVTEGPLYGMEGLIQSIDKRKGRAKVRINFIGQPRVVELSVSILNTA